MRSNILAFAVGVGLLQLREALPFWPPLVTLLLAALPVLWPACRRSCWGRVLVLLASALFGFSWAALLAGQRLLDQLPVDWEGRDVQVVGVVAALPHGFERGERFAFAVEAVETPAAVVPQRIMLSWYHGWLEDEWREGLKIRPGERWRFTVRLKRPHGNANPLAFDYEAWLFERGLRATGYVRPHAAAQRLEAFVLQPAYVIERLRDHLRQSFSHVLGDAAYAGVLIALAVGDQQAIPGEQWRLFRQTGVTHLMSIKYLLKRLAGRYMSRL